MSEKRTISIGVTINLGNYENLHLEVSDIAETRSDAGELRRFLSDVLDDFAANNATAKQAIDKYRERILDNSEDQKSDDSINISFNDKPSADDLEDTPEKIESSEIIDNEEENHTETTSDTDESDRKDLPHLISDTSKKITEINETKEKSESEETKKEDETEPPKMPDGVSQGEYTCEKCGAKVSKVQRDVSNMFMGKTLCKNCMK